MMNRHSTLILGFKNEKGQVALFIALAFQILFLFFAMVINVGLLVHHKINLQNSVDLAAYYGASKQAEDMNVVAHTNYQIRQSWKLLAWRYRMLGSAGDDTEHPYDKQTHQLRIGNGIPGDIEGVNPMNPTWYDDPAFCISYHPFKEKVVDSSGRGENNCLNIQTSVQLFSSPPVIAGFLNLAQAVQTATTNLRLNALAACGQFGAFNYLQLAEFVVAFNFDQANRLNFLKQFANDMSSDTGDFYDIDGQSVKTGIQTTLSNNLTAANRSGLGTVKIYNSLGDPNCGSSGSSTATPKWLSQVNLYPGFAYVDYDCGQSNSTQITPIPKELTSTLPTATTPGLNFYDQISQLAPWVGFQSDTTSSLNYSIGVEKNPWCMAYVGVSATATPSIPFSPFGSVTLKARSFAKPFGGRIGPWYAKRWDRGNTSSNSTANNVALKTDGLLPPRWTGATNVTSGTDPTRAPNYSRFVGDIYGLKTRNDLFQYGRAIFGLAPDYATAPVTSNQNYTDGAPAYAHWSHLPFTFESKGEPDSGDILAWNSTTNSMSRMRYLEVSAILPDAFDMAYYSIEPDFYHNYFTRLQNGYMAARGSGLTTPVYPDIGYHKGYNTNGLNLNEFSVKDQVLMVIGSQNLQALGVDVDKKLTYIGKLWTDVLTGWAETSLTSYDQLDTEFGKCVTYPKGISPDGLTGTAAPPTSGNCQVGGRSGYAVKTVSSDFLTSEMQNIGGEGSSGTILNQPPSDF